jgi:FAD/FMN-containing dehydrogenase
MTSITEINTIDEGRFILPPDVSASTLKAALLDMSKIVGAENVKVYTKTQMKSDEEGGYWNLPKEHDLFYVLEKDTFLASAVVSPGSTEEVSAVVKAANKYLTPLWPTSMGRNLGKAEQKEMFMC